MAKTYTAQEAMAWLVGGLELGGRKRYAVDKTGVVCEVNCINQEFRFSTVNNENGRYSAVNQNWEPYILVEEKEND